jgi:prolyl oligopeptidase
LHKLIFAAAAAFIATAAAAQTMDDPYLWLEQIDGARAVAQVKQWNQATEDLLTKSAAFDAYRSRALDILNDEQQIAEPEEMLGDQVTSLWRDAKNPRGLWRIASLSSYVAGKPEWRTLIDVDALGRSEGKSWVWHRADCLAPDYSRCLVSLSPGGTDADVLREFDVPTAKFIDGGFTLPDAKSSSTWVDPDHLLVGTDYGQGSLTVSGYPRVVKLWTRGTPLASAKTVFTGAADDVGATPFASIDGDKRWVFINRGKTTWTNEVSLFTDDGRLVKTSSRDG